jgi:hypothetical protein
VGPELNAREIARHQGFFCPLPPGKLSHHLKNQCHHRFVRLVVIINLHSRAPDLNCPARASGQRSQLPCWEAFIWSLPKSGLLPKLFDNVTSLTYERKIYYWAKQDRGPGWRIKRLGDSSWSRPCALSTHPRQMRELQSASASSMHYTRIRHKTNCRS